MVCSWCSRRRAFCRVVNEGKGGTELDEKWTYRLHRLNLSMLFGVNFSGTRCARETGSVAVVLDLFAGYIAM